MVRMRRYEVTRGVRIIAPTGRKTRFCKTTPCIKKSPLYYNEMALCTSGTSVPRVSMGSAGHRRAFDPQTPSRKAA